MTNEHAWCHCAEIRCGIPLTGHEGHCCLTRDATCTDDAAGALGWLVEHRRHCTTDHQARIHELAATPRTED